MLNYFIAALALPQIIVFSIITTCNSFNYLNDSSVEMLLSFAT